MPRLKPVSYKRLVEVFEAEGFVCVRTEGDHMVFTKPGVNRPVVIPKYAAVSGLHHQEQSADCWDFSRPLFRTPRKTVTASGSVQQPLPFDVHWLSGLRYNSNQTRSHTTCKTTTGTAARPRAAIF